MRKLTEAGLHLIKNFEGCRLTAYKPVPTEKYWTIGWGHYGPDVQEGATITQAMADGILVRDMERYVAYTNDNGNVTYIDKLTQNQFDALVSFCYNCGPGNLKELCKGRTPAQIAESITKYNKGGGKVLAGLERRREAELELFNTPDKPGQEAEDEEMNQVIEQLQNTVSEQAKRLAVLEKLVNVTGNQEPPVWAYAALTAAKAAGAITTTADKGMAEIKVIQTMYNMGLFNKKGV